MVVSSKDRLMPIDWKEAESRTEFADLLSCHFFDATFIFDLKASPSDVPIATLMFTSYHRSPPILNFWSNIFYAFFQC